MQRCSAAALVILSTYLGAVVVERAFTSNAVRAGGRAEVQDSDPLRKLKLELVVRHRLALARKGAQPDPVVAIRQNR